jgi:hypothetical protein
MRACSLVHQQRLPSNGYCSIPAAQVCVVSFCTPVQVSVELFVPHSGAHVKDTFWPCTFNLSKVILVSHALALSR